MTPVRFRIHWYSVGLLCTACSTRREYIYRQSVYIFSGTRSYFYSNPSSNHSQSSLFIELSLCVKSQKSHSEFQAVKTEVEHTNFAIAAMFV